MKRFLTTKLASFSKRCFCLLAGVTLATALPSCDDRTAAEVLSENGIPATPESLMEATVSNRTHLVSLLIGAGVLPDQSRDENGHTALMLAARHGYSEAAQILTSHSQDLNLVDERGMTALAHSVCSEQYGIAKALLEAGAAADVTCHRNQTLLVASVLQSQLPALELLLEHGAKSGIDDALLIAVTERKLNIVKKLIKCGANANTGSDFGMPVLNIAMQNGDTRCVDLLLANGADPNIRDDESRSALGYAIADRDTSMVSKFLKSGARTELPCDGESLAIQAAVLNKAPKILETLITEGSAVIHPRVVTQAVDHGSPEVLGVLLDHGADIDTPDSTGDTLLTRAIRGGDPDQVKLLIERGAKPDSISREGQPLLALATALRRPDCIRELIAAGADPNTPLGSPISEEYRDLVGSRTFAFYAKRDSRFTPLMVAASHGHGDTVRALIKGGASRSKYTRNWKRYPISFASEARNIEAQQLIVGYDPKTRSEHYKIIIDLSSQRAVMYKNGSVHLSSRISTGKSGYRTPTGNYVVTHKHRTHTSTLYDSPMPYFMRLSCQAFGTHVGYVPNYPASHGCIRMPQSGARAFFNAAPRGTPVNIVQ